MKITVLGCGSSGGVPLVGGDWGACDPCESRNRRRRVSVLVEEGDEVLLVDTSPDLREQLLACGATRLTALFYTHSHADHTHGIDDLRRVNWLIGKPLPIYGDAATLEELRRRFDYIFNGPVLTEHFYKPSLIPQVITRPLRFGDIQVSAFTQDHGYGISTGYRFNDFAYSTDAKNLDEAAFDALKGVKVWVVDCVREAAHPTHAHLERTLDWIARVKPERAYLTHMDHTMDYATLAAKLPAGVWPAYDGLVLEC